MRRDGRRAADPCRLRAQCTRPEAARVEGALHGLRGQRAPLAVLGGADARLECLNGHRPDHAVGGHVEGRSSRTWPPRWRWAATAWPTSRCCGSSRSSRDRWVWCEIVALAWELLAWTPAARPGRDRPPLGAETAPPAPLLSRRAAGPRGPPPAAEARRTMALGHPGHRRGHYPAGHPIKLTSPNATTTREGEHQGP
jgi:hypothetical protein